MPLYCFRFMNLAKIKIHMNIASQTVRKYLQNNVEKLCEVYKTYKQAKDHRPL